MSKILGLDLGVNSIGWAVVDDEKASIIDCGVRIFPEGVENLGQGEKETSKNAQRREKRQLRRHYYRKRLSKIKLLETLIPLKMCPLSLNSLKKWKNWNNELKSDGRKFPNDPEFIEWLKMNPYALRKKALEEDLSLEQLGRIFYHFIQRRGFYSSRKGKDSGKIYQGENNTIGILETEKEIGYNKTLGTTLYEMILPEHQTYIYRTDENRRPLRARNRYTLREMYVKEFHAIWEKQAPHLGLNDKTVTIFKSFHLSGNNDSERNKQRINKIYLQYGIENVTITGKTIKVAQQISLKTLFGGRIEINDETHEILYRSQDSLLFWQRPLRSQKHLLSKCTFEKRIMFDKTTNKWIETGPTPCPISHPDFELYRAWQLINNIRYGRKEQPLDASQRQTVLNVISYQDKVFDFKVIIDALKLQNEYFNYDADQKVSGCPTIKKLKSLFPTEIWVQNKHEIWHDFMFFEDEELLTQRLIKKYHFTEEKAQKSAKITLEDGYASISLKAIHNILPFLEKGFIFQQAVLLGGIKNTFGSRWEYFKDYHSDIEQFIKDLCNGKKYHEGEIIQNIKEYLSSTVNNFGFNPNDKAFLKLYHPSREVGPEKKGDYISPVENLRNPLVQIGLNEMRRLVNYLLKKYRSMPEFGPDFCFDRIHVEVGRDLKNNKKRRQEIRKENAINEQKNKEARERIIEAGLKPSRDNIIKYLLYSEIEQKNGIVICPYTGKTIRLSDLLGPHNFFQIEHIIPYSVSLDDSFGNKTLCEANFNRSKGELTPYQFYLKNSSKSLWNADSWEEIEQRVFQILPYKKARRFTSKKPAMLDDFIQRQLNDTRYISKKSVQILREICDDVRSFPGQLIADLRRLWGLNDILSEPITDIPLNDLNINESEPTIHYLIVDENNHVKKAIPKINFKPIPMDNELAIPGEIKKETGNKFYFESDSKYYASLKIPANGFETGKYWAFIKAQAAQEFIPRFTPQPQISENVIIIKGNLKKKRFINESHGINFNTNKIIEDGYYWAIIPVIKAEIKQNDINDNRKNENKISIQGRVSNQKFISSIYSCEAQLINGFYTALLDFDVNNADFLPALNLPRPPENYYTLNGTVDSQGIFCPDMDYNWKLKADVAPGRYFIYFKIQEIINFQPIENPKPIIDKNNNEKIIESLIRVDTETGEIIIDPKKNREDQRHHAIDAIVIASATTSYYQKLSTYFGNLKNKQRNLAPKPKFEQPNPHFQNAVKEAISKILVSYRTNYRVLVPVYKRIRKNHDTYVSKGYSVKGQLHKDTFYGGYILDQGEGKIVSAAKYLPGIKPQQYHVRCNITEIKDHKHVAKIVDTTIKKLIENRLQNVFNIDISKPYNIPNGFFFDKDKNPAIRLPNRKGGDPVPVYTVRIFEYKGNAVKLKPNINCYVDPRNNHHCIIYKDVEGNLKFEMVKFWDAVNRLRHKQPLYQLPPDGSQIIATVQENDMFIFNYLYASDISEDMKIPYEELSKYLYRVQKISSTEGGIFLTFRHHLASTIKNPEEELRIQSLRSWERHQPIKVKINMDGTVNKIIK